MGKRPNSNDVARHAKVSRTTVSLVINGVETARLSDETRRRVWESARALNYMPNAVGRSLVRGKTETIALVLRDLALLEVDLYLQPLLFGIVKRAKEAGYGLRVDSIGSTEITSLLESGYIDGMIIQNLDTGDERLKGLVSARKPVVVLGSQGFSGEHSVQTDNVSAARRATQHLLDIGRRRIAHVPYSKLGIYATDRRHEGYRRAIEAANLQYKPEMVVSADFSSDTGYKAMLRLLDLVPEPPDGVFASSDAVAIGVMAAALDAGYRVPEDIAVVGFDDIGTTHTIRPSLTTVRSHPTLAGHVATDMLLALINGKKPPNRTEIIDIELVKRGSTIEGFDADAFAAMRRTVSPGTAS